MIRRLRHLLPLHAKLTLYNCLINRLFDYGDTVWDDKNNDTLMAQLQVIQNKAAEVLLNLSPRSSSTEVLDRLDLKTLLRIIKTLTDYIQIRNFDSSFRLSGYSLQLIKWKQSTTTYVQKGGNNKKNILNARKICM